MFKKILKTLITIIGLVLGYIAGDIVVKTDYILSLSMFKSNMMLSYVIRIIIVIVITLVIGFIVYLLSSIISKGIMKLLEHIESGFQKLSGSEILFGTIGVILGLIVGFFIFYWVGRNSTIGTLISILGMVFMAYLGGSTAAKKREELMSFFVSIRKPIISKEKKSKIYKGDPKILDTSVIIDGRIFDICQTGFIEGTLVIPTFVLDELRHIADSADSLKRNRGRRGLDVLNKIQKELNIEVEIYEKDFPEIAEVDSKLLKLAQVLGGKVVTNDYNLNKVAEFHKVPVLNINELSNAVKPVLIPGEEMTVQVVKDGKESNQGVAYLDDGTMIVVEGGRKFIGETIDVVVTSVLQTAAGRMIFARRKEDI